LQGLDPRTTQRKIRKGGNEKEISWEKKEFYGEFSSATKGSEQKRGAESGQAEEKRNNVGQE